MVARRRRFALLLAALLSVACACSASAQREDSTSLTGAARMSLDGGAILQPGTSHRASIGGEYMRFVSEHWQLGLAPSVGASTSMVSIYGRSSLAGIANYVTGTGNLRWYAGGYASAAENAQQGQFGVVGAQVGALYLLSPLAAFRGELTWRTPTRAGSVASWQFIAFLDPYLPATGSERVSLPSDAAVESRATCMGTPAVP
ncbi:MAG: hypothetical protein ABJE47_21770 [bacterium]